MTEQLKAGADTSEGNQSIWLLTISPIIWAVHFLVCYLAAAIWCAKVAEPDASFGVIRLVYLGATSLALVGISITAWEGYRRHGIGVATVPHDFDTPADRHRFLGFAALLLSGLSAVAVLYVALAAVFFRSCY